ncbi:MAG: hypothetical protein HYX77_05060 [Acidobacteria bacterium]|nr:hypothetical protein [Acidobacteriota bacterium]
MGLSRHGFVPLAVMVVMLVMTSARTSAQVDFSGEWRTVTHEEDLDLVGDYTGMPINDEARQRFDTWDPLEFSLPEMQCRPHTLAHAGWATNAGFRQFRWWKEIDRTTLATIAYKMRGGWMEMERTIWMDGRPHPSELAPHTWLGFSTGRWERGALRVVTTHLKEGYIYRNGPTVSDKGVVTEVFSRHGNHLMSAMFLEDPVYLTEPYVRTSTWIIETRARDLQERYPCGLNEVVTEVIRPAGEVPHYLPGTNSRLREFAAEFGLPWEATRGGAETMYPEYQEKIKTLKIEPVQPPALLPGATRVRRPGR